MIFPVLNRPFLKITGRRTYLVIADLHLGVNLKWFKKGIRMNPEYEIMDVIRVIEEEKIDDLILLGDIKEHIFEVKRSIQGLFQNLFSHVSRVHVTRGNHDPVLDSREYPNVTLHAYDGMIIEEEGQKIGLLHGHGFPRSDFKEVDVLILGHLHPAIRIVTMGSSRLEKAWLLYSRAEKPRKVIIMPTANPLLVGASVTELNPRVPPLDKLMIDLDDFEVVLLNGTSLGRISDLKNGAGGEIRTRELLRD